MRRVAGCFLCSHFPDHLIINPKMSCCRRRSSASPLACYAKSLKHHAITEASKPCEMKFPMYTVAWEDVRKMEIVLPHEDLIDQGMLVDFDKKMGRAAFVSHQWLSAEHPDPDFQQMTVLKEALTRFTSRTFLIKPLVLGQSFQFGAQNISTEVFQSKPLFLWYDYFSLPQLKTSTDTWKLGDLQKPIDAAIESIPAYVASCELFLVLCPMVQDLNQKKTFGQVTWASRGWCRMEKTLRQFSDQSSYIIIKSAECFEAVSTPVAAVIDGCPGNGSFGFNEDKLALGMVLKDFLKQKIRNHLQCQDFAFSRAFLNLTHWFLRGFPSECQASSISDMTGWEGSLSGASSIAEEFLDQNGFSSINEVDKAGWYPICYAALNGNPHLIQGLLDMRAKVDSTVQAHPCIGNAPFISVLSLSAYFSQNEAVQVLLASKANPEAGTSFNALHSALSGNNAECTQLLCREGCSLEKPSVMGLSALSLGAHFGSTAAVAELLTHLNGPGALSKSLHLSVMRSGSAQMINQLLHAGADINEKLRQPLLSIIGFLWLLGRWKYSLSRDRTGLELPYHIQGATPLLCAILCCQFEAAAALIVKGARVDLPNSKGATAIDIARREVSVPPVIMKALQGDLGARTSLEDLVLGTFSHV